MNGERAIAWVQDIDAERPLFFASYRIPPAAAARFEKEFLGAFRTQFSRVRVGSSMLGGDPVVPHDQLVRMPVYRDLIALLNIYHAAGGVLLRVENALGAICIFRSREAGPFSEQQEEFLVRLIPHLERALNLHYRLLSTELERAATAATLNRLSYGVVICDRNARILVSNTAASAFLDSRCGWRRTGDHLSCCTPAQSKLLCDRIRAITDGLGPAASLDVDCESEPVRIVISRLSGPTRFGFEHTADLVLVTLTDPTADVVGSSEVLTQLFELTEAESRVALGLVQGKTINALAEAMKVSRNTIRTHVAAAFSKTQTNRQADLVRLVLQAVGPFGLG
jgi:DNA-binding CsgD family transcriptional regulator